jgi:ketosteroid isomerase-like protein
MGWPDNPHGLRDIKLSMTPQYPRLPAADNSVLHRRHTSRSRVSNQRVERAQQSPRQGAITMSVQEIQALAQQFADAFDTKNIEAVLDMLSDDLEVFDHVPYRFDNKRLFAAFLSAAAEGIASMSFGFRQPSCRVFNEHTGIVNAYDSFTGVTKDGKVQRSTGELHWSSSSRAGSGRS